MRIDLMKTGELECNYLWSLSSTTVVLKEQKVAVHPSVVSLQADLTERPNEEGEEAL